MWCKRSTIASIILYNLAHQKSSVSEDELDAASYYKTCYECIIQKYLSKQMMLVTRSRADFRGLPKASYAMAYRRYNYACIAWTDARNDYHNDSLPAVLVDEHL